MKYPMPNGGEVHKGGHSMTESRENREEVKDARKDAMGGSKRPGGGKMEMGSVKGAVRHLDGLKE